MNKFEQVSRDGYQSLGRGSLAWVGAGVGWGLGVLYSEVQCPEGL